MPLAFMSIATSSIAPTPALEMVDANVWKSGKAAPDGPPHSPSRDM